MRGEGDNEGYGPVAGPFAITARAEREGRRGEANGDPALMTVSLSGAANCRRGLMSAFDPLRTLPVPVRISSLRAVAWWHRVSHGNPPAGHVIGLGQNCSASVARGSPPTGG